MSTTITSNLEIEDGSDTVKIFSVKDDSTGLPVDLSEVIAEIQISFEFMQNPIIFRSDLSPNITVSGLLGRVQVQIPWMNAFNTDYGTGTYKLYLRYPNGLNVLQYKGFVTIVRNPTGVITPGSETPTNPFPSMSKGPKPAADSQSVVLATDHPTISVSSVAGLGSLAAVPEGDGIGVAVGQLPSGAVGVRIYLRSTDSVTFTIAGVQPEVSPDVTFTISYSDTGPNWDENLSSGQMMYVVSTTGTPKFRWI